MDTYGALLEAVANWLNREDLSDQFPQFVRLAETEIYRDLRCQDNEFVVTHTSAGWSFTDGDVQANTDGVHLALPSNYREMSLVTWNGFPLTVASKAMLQARLAAQIDSRPSYFAMSANRIEFCYPMDTDPDEWASTDVLVYTYYGVESLCSMPTWQVAYNPVENPPVEDESPEELEQLDSNTTRMLQRHPDLYLHGTLYQASLLLRDDVLAAKHGGLFKAAMASIKREGKRARYAGGTKQMASAH